jgi:hypothetical protein
MNPCQQWVACVQEALRRLLAECAHVDVRRAALAAAAPQHPAAYDASFLLPFAAMVGCTQWSEAFASRHHPPVLLARQLIVQPTDSLCAALHRVVNMSCLRPLLQYRLQNVACGSSSLLVHLPAEHGP